MYCEFQFQSSEQCKLFAAQLSLSGFEWIQRGDRIWVDKPAEDVLPWVRSIPTTRSLVEVL